MSQIFEDESDSEVDFKTENEYAKNYNKWRQREELNKLKTKYGEETDIYEETSSSSDDDEDGVALTTKIEKDFFKTLACLKNKDPRIYDENINFFDDELNVSKHKKKKGEVPLYIKDYERNIILEKGGVLSDEENVEEKRLNSPTYVEEQNLIKENLKQALNSVDDEENEDWGGIFKQRQKNKEEKEKEEADYKQWLSGQKKNINDEKVASELKPLKEYWNKSDLDEGEKFLRDYILHKKFLDKEEDYIPTYDEVVHDSDQDLSNDEQHIEKQEEFEHKYNFRFEEPDQEFIKRYPRTMENSVRRKDDKRKLKRIEIKERKKKEKEEKMQELKKLQELKQKEIEEKLEKLKEITGNPNFGFAGEDIDGDFDPDAHDKRMQALFNDEFYEGPGEEQKPEFPEIDEELEIENWERYNCETDGNETNYTLHCEDEGFNMDCDYDPQREESLTLSNGKKKRKRKSKFAEAVSKPKPKFDPNDKTYEKYFDEYYKLDCEDIIGDIPCRFKYRKVVPNDFGLSIEEILLAKERELNKWCSLKKAVQIRPNHVEKYDQIAYKKKSQNMNLKKKILPSLFVAEPEENNEKSEFKDNTLKLDNDITKNEKGEMRKNPEPIHEDIDIKSADQNINKRKKKKEAKFNSNDVKNLREENKDTINEKFPNSKTKNMFTKDTNQLNTQTTTFNENQHKKRKRNNEKPQNDIKKKMKKTKQNNKNTEIPLSDARLAAYGINPKKFKNKLKYGHINFL